jgi:prophage regulatory protein
MWEENGLEQRTQLDTFLKIREVEQMTGLSRSSIYALMAKGEFPQNFSLGGSRSVAWSAAKILSWQMDCINRTGREKKR